jgi:hypothetical protein
MAIWYILWSFGIFLPFFGILYQEKSGNPVTDIPETFLCISSGENLTELASIDELSIALP